MDSDVRRQLMLADAVQVADIIRRKNPTRVEQALVSSDYKYTYYTENYVRVCCRTKVFV